MRHRFSPLVLVLLCGAVAPAPADAQTPQRFTVSVNGGYQPSTTSFDDRVTFDLNRETATVDTDYAVDAGPLFDAGVSLRIWKGLAVGVSFSRFSVDGSADVSASLPHPLFFQRAREVSGQPGGLTRDETGVHIQAQYQLPSFGPVQVVVGGGPSILNVRQSIVTDVNFTEAFPYDTAEFVGVDSRQVSRTATGVNVGADIRWMFSPHIGVGGLVRFSRGSVDLTIDNRSVEVDAGGLHVGGGIRIGF